jgi:hypothetical protein
MNTSDRIQEIVVRLHSVYQNTRFELMSLGDGALTELVHEAEEFQRSVEFSERVAGEILSAQAQMVLGERKQKQTTKGKA